MSQIYLSQETTDAYLRLLGGLGTRIPITEGDAVFYSYDTRPIWVERKRIKQLAMCAMGVGNMNSQVRRAQEEGNYAWLYLMVEGLWRPGADGLIEVPGQRDWRRLEVFGPESYVEYSRVDNYLNTLEVVEGVGVKRVSSERESAATLIDLYHWWQKPEEEHQSTKTWQRGSTRQLGLSGKPSLLRRWAAELPGIGWKLSRAVEEKFGCVHEMVMAEEKEWREIEGVGKEKARRVMREIHKEGGPRERDGATNNSYE